MVGKGPQVKAPLRESDSNDLFFSTFFFDITGGETTFESLTIGSKYYIMMTFSRNFTSFCLLPYLFYDNII